MTTLAKTAADHASSARAWIARAEERDYDGHAASAVTAANIATAHATLASALAALEPYAQTETAAEPS